MLAHLADEMNKLDAKQFRRVQKVIQDANHFVLDASIIRDNRFHETVTKRFLNDFRLRLHSLNNIPAKVVSLAENFIVTRFRVIRETRTANKTSYFVHTHKYGRYIKPDQGEILPGLLNLFGLKLTRK